MKINKFNEEIKTTNFSDLEEWSVPDPVKKKIYSGKKILNLELGSKVIELLHEYDLGIKSVDTGKWLNHQQLLLPDENNLKEYRVHIGKRPSFDTFIDNYEYENDVDYKKLSLEEQEKLREMYDEDDSLMESEYVTDVEFSVFLPSNIKQNINEAAMSDASIYLKLLNNSIPDIIHHYVDNDVFLSDTKEVINFINLKKIEITNKNLEFVKTISYRLHKDSKVFAAFEELIDDKNDKDNLFNDWLKLL
jgi:hypothetical protein